MTCHVCIPLVLGTPSVLTGTGTCVVACLLKHVQQSVCFLRTTQRKFIVNDVHWPHDQNSCPIMKSTGGNNE